MEVKVLKQELIGPASVLAILEEREKKDKSLEGFAQKVKDSIIKFSKINKAQELKLIEALKGLNIARMTDAHIVQIATILPKDIDELKIIFAGSKTTLTQEDLEKIQSAIKQHNKNSP